MSHPIVTPGWKWRGIQNTIRSTTIAIAELIDNALDAGATEIEIDHDGKEFQIWDNGCGVENLRLLLVDGMSGSSKHATKSGYYGQGAKVGMAYFGNLLHVESVCNGVWRAVEWDTDIDIETGVMGDGLGDEVQEECGDDNYTLLNVTRFRSVTRIDQSVRRKLQQLFLPALESGVSIKACGEILEASHPNVEDAIEITDCVAGQKYTLQAGILTGGTSRMGVHVCRLRRYVSDMSPWSEIQDTANLYVAVRLHVTKATDWQLTTNKETIASEELREQLMLSIMRHIAPLVEQCKKAAQHIDIAAWRAVGRRLPLVVPDDEGDKQLAESGGECFTGERNGGKKKPNKASAKRRNGCDEGSTHRSDREVESRNGIRIEWEAMGTIAHDIAFDKHGRQLIVRLNVDDAYYGPRSPLSPSNEEDITHQIGALLFDRMRQKQFRDYAKFVVGWEDVMTEEGWSWDALKLFGRFMKHWDDQLSTIKRVAK